MIMKVFAVYDTQAKIFSSPSFMLSIGTAKRGFMDQANDKTKLVGQHPEDYTLFHLGEYNDETGTFKNNKTPDNLGVAITYVQDPQNKI